MKALATAILLMLAAPLTLLAQATAHGSVVDAQTGAPIVGATVVVTGTANRTLTDQGGSFTLTAPDSISSLSVSSVGYVSAEVSVSSTAEALNMRLVPAHQRLPGVEVTARRPAPSAVELSESDLQRASGLSLEQSVNTQPGLFMQSRTPLGGARITIRGYYPSTSGNSPNSNGLGYTGLPQQHPDHRRHRPHDPRRHRLFARLGRSR